MKILKIEWRNFGSYGNKQQCIELPQEPKLFQIIGNNGAGKTTLANIISFCLYGKVEGKNLSELPNRINGNAWTRIEFETHNKTVVVERGYDPSFMNLTVNGIPDKRAKDMQEYLSEDIIGIPYKVFNNTISLSINDFKSFVKMSPADKRMIVDKIFGFYVLNQMREVLKKQNKLIKEELDKLNFGLNSSVKNIERSNSEMEMLLNSIKEKSKLDLEKLNDDLKKFKDLREIHHTKVREFVGQETDLNNLYNETSRKLIESKKDYNDLERRLRLYENSKCPTCESNLEDAFHQNVKTELISNKNEKNEAINETQDILNRIESDRKKYLETKTELEEKGRKINLKITEITNEILKINSGNSDLQLESLKNIIKSLEKDKDDFDSKLEKIQDREIWVKKLDEILGEKGVKQMAIKMVLPSINSEIDLLLKEMALPFQLYFDDEFNCTISQMGIKIPPSTLSVGEMKKVDFIVLISIIKLMKMKFNKLNLLFLDEIFSSIDSEGMYEIMKILKKSSKEMGLNILVMNFAPMPSEFFDLKLSVKKHNMFSSVSIEGF